MKWTQVTQTTDIKLDGIKVETTHVNKNLNSVVLTDPKGNVVRFGSEADYYSLKVYTPTPPEKKTVFEVSGAVDGVTIQPQNFDSLSEAKNFMGARILEKDLIITETEITIED